MVLASKLNSRIYSVSIILIVLLVNLLAGSFTFPLIVKAAPYSSFPTLGDEILVLDYNPSVWDGTRGGPHNFDVVELNKDGHRYWGYYGTAEHDAVGLAFSDDLENWVRYSTTTPIIDGVGWPTVGIQGTTIHMFYIKGYPTPNQKIYRATSPTSDGYTFTEQELVIDNPNNPHDPFLWHNPVDGEWWLLWKEDMFTIKSRHATTIEDLSSASTMTLRIETDTSYNTLASPSIFYWAGMETYYMTNEAHPTLWTTRAFYSDTLGPSCFDGACECSNSPILPNDDACGFAHVEGNTLYFYYSHRVGPGHQWNAKLKKASLEVEPPPPPDPASWWKASWQYRRNITVDGTKVAGSLTDFPVLVDITSPALASHAQDDGDDIAFTDDDGNQLNHEIESYDSSSGHLVAWVSADLSSPADTMLYLYYGNPDASNQENPTNVWDSNFMLVHHLEETSAPLYWQRYDGNPTLDGTKHGFGSTIYDSDTDTYHHFCSWGSVLHFTSSDGKEWTPDDANNPVLADAGVPMAWKEGDTWYMLYRYGDPLVIGLADSTDGIHWTKYEGNPVLVGDAGEWDDPSYGLDPWGVIKVGSTYYLWYNNIATSPRSTGLATSTDLTSWTKDLNNPIFTGGRYCIFPFKYGPYYYMLVPYYHAFPYGLIELYRCSNPTFYTGDREYLGIVITPGPEGAWDDRRFDTPSVFTDTVYRDTYEASGNELWMYYSATGTPTGSGANWWTGMCIEPDISDALGRFTAARFTYDSTSNANDGQILSGVDMNAVGYIDGADDFDGVDGHIDCGDSGSLKGMSALTVEAWFKPDAWNNGIVSKWGAWTAGSYILYQGSYGKIGWGVITGANYASMMSPSAFAIGQWRHLTGVYDGSNIKLYIDGAQVGTPSSLTGTVGSTSHPCYIGRYTTVRMNGIIDEVRISNIARSQTWILTEYRNQYSPSTFYSVGSEQTLSCIIESCDAAGTEKNTFTPSEAVRVVGSGYPPSETYDIYVVQHGTLVDAQTIPTPVTPKTSVTPNPAGDIPSTTIVWSPTLIPGKYDVVVDVNHDGKYNAGFDAVDDDDIDVNAGFFVIPEYIIGTVLAIVMCFAGLAVYKRSKHSKPKAPRLRSTYI